MKACCWVLVFFACGLVLRAQPSWDSLYCSADAKMDRGDWEGACCDIQQCWALAPEKMRTPCANGIRQMCLTGWLEEEDMEACRLRNSLQHLMFVDSLRSDDPRFAEMWLRYPWSRDYNEVKWMFGRALENEGKEDEAIAVYQSIIDEELQAPCADQAGFFATMEMSRIMRKRQDYAAALHYVLLTQSVLPERRICSYDEGNHQWINTNLGLAYAGLGMQSDAITFLSKLAFEERGHTIAEPCLPLDSLIALMQRIDTTPLRMQLEEAIDNAHYETVVKYPGAPYEHHEIRCWITLAGHELTIFNCWFSPGRRPQTEFRFDREWEYPYSKASCQAQMRLSPLYRRLSGVPAEEVYRWH